MNQKQHVYHFFTLLHSPNQGFPLSTLLDSQHLPLKDLMLHLTRLFIITFPNPLERLLLGPNTDQTSQWLPLLGAKSLVPRFGFFSLSILSKTVQNKNFN